MLTTTQERPETAAHGLVAHSVLDAHALSREVAARYDLPEGVRASLLFRGMNDVYVVTAGDQRWALRVWRGTWRGLDEVENELSFLNFLKSREFPASFPLHLRDGSWYFTLDAPEALRAVALYEWAPGVKVFDAHTPETAAEVGRLLARMHVLGREYVPAHDVDLSRGHLMRDLPDLLDLVADRPGEAQDYALFAPRVQAVIDGFDRYDLPTGACHGDLHPSNAHVADDGRITILDFDGCGTGYLLKDIANYVFGSDFYGFAPELGEAFVRGYNEIRPMTEDEFALLDFFVFVKTFQLAAGIAHNVNSVGRASLRFRGLGWFASQIRSGMERHARLLGD
ncbi:MULTISPECIES: phosphotransferase enzyme family protein [unclassified Novosphingobium]|uniref:phosphotransferase enzyme family protein n=1 Tax=unclassified Novosphingobium TaxID=2644732 RepID=UPI00135B9A3E|nr:MULTISPECIES: phosphotransferase [unclassified Novosphingobium]